MVTAFPSPADIVGSDYAQLLDGAAVASTVAGLIVLAVAVALFAVALDWVEQR